MDFNTALVARRLAARTYHNASLIIRYLSLLSCFLSACPLLAQTGTLRGQVTDDSGAVIPAARITLTGPSGRPKTAGLAPVNYRVQAFAPDLALPQPAKI